MARYLALHPDRDEKTCAQSRMQHSVFDPIIIRKARHVLRVLRHASRVRR